MIKRHCVQLSPTNQPQWRLGIWQIFEPWINPNLQRLQGYIAPQFRRPHIIEFHFRRVVHRLVRSLARLYRKFHEWDNFLEEGGLDSERPELVFDIPEEGGIAADSVFHYFNLFIDDLARIVPYILVDDESQAKEPDGFNMLKKRLKKGILPASPSLCELFDELDRDDSWWSLGFSIRVGIRQRLTHYTDLVDFQLHWMTDNVRLVRIGEGLHIPDFVGALREVFCKFCEWLDRLDPLLLRLLSEKLMASGVPWDPYSEECPAVALPLVEGAQLDASHYLFLPVSGNG